MAAPPKTRVARNPRILLRATQIGMTATPKETKYVSNIHYFGDPSTRIRLKQGIRDGFLAPYKVINVTSTVDVEGYRPPKGQYGPKATRSKTASTTRETSTERWCSTSEPARRPKGHRFSEGERRPVPQDDRFLGREEHADRMRQALINENKDLCDQNHRYVMRITGSDTDGQAQLDNFIDPEVRYPVCHHVPAGHQPVSTLRPVI